MKHSLMLNPSNFQEDDKIRVIGGRYVGRIGRILAFGGTLDNLYLAVAAIVVFEGDEGDDYNSGHVFFDEMVLLERQLRLFE
jgi:hypothetical protein